MKSTEEIAEGLAVAAYSNIRMADVRIVANAYLAVVERYLRMADDLQAVKEDNRYLSQELTRLRAELRKPAHVAVILRTEP